MMVKKGIINSLTLETTRFSDKDMASPPYDHNFE